MRWRKVKRSKEIFGISFLKIILVFLVIFVVVSIYLLFRANILIIRSIDVSTEKVECVDGEQVKAASKLLGKNFFFINSKKIEDDLKKNYICIKSVTISKFFPNKIKLDIFGREPAAILVVLRNEEASESSELEEFSKLESTMSAEADESFLIDNEGILYSKNIEQVFAPKVYVSGLNLTLGEKIEKNLIRNLLKILEKLKIFGLNLTESKIYSENILLINSVPKIILVLEDKIDTQIASLQLIMNEAKINEENLEFIDLRFDKPIIRFAPKKK